MVAPVSELPALFWSGGHVPRGVDLYENLLIEPMSPCFAPATVSGVARPLTSTSGSNKIVRARRGAFVRVGQPFRSVALAGAVSSAPFCWYRRARQARGELVDF